MRRERTDIERERMQAYREMPVKPPHQRKMCVFTHEKRRRRKRDENGKKNEKKRKLVNLHVKETIMYHL
jgi:hypothetical protein